MRGVPSHRWEAKPKFTKEYFAMQTTERKAVREMKAQGVQHFLVVYALVSDLYCPATIRAKHWRGFEYRKGGSALQHRRHKAAERRARRTCEGQSEEGQAQRKIAKQDEVTRNTGPLRSTRPSLFFYASAVRRFRPLATFCAMAMMSLRSASAALLKHFLSW
jgi:hypothetical protein